jgi:hypothetical protein
MPVTVQHNLTLVKIINIGEIKTIGAPSMHPEIEIFQPITVKILNIGKTSG